MAADTTFTLTFKTIADATGLTAIREGIDSLNGKFEALKRGAEALGLVSIAAEGIKKAFDAINEAANQEAQAYSFKALIGNAEQAEEKLKELREFWQQSGVFSFGELAEAAKTLVLIGTGADNLIPRLKSMSEIAAATGDNVGSVVAAYERLRLSIERGTEPMIRGMGGMSASIIAMLRALEDETGKTEPQVLAMFKDHAVSIELLNKALADATTGAGRYADAIAGRAATMKGAIQTVRTAWESVEDAFGAPIRDAVTPIIVSIGKALSIARAWATQLGEDIAHVISALALIAKEDGWKTALLAAWTIVVNEMAALATNILVQTFSTLGPALASALWAGYLTKLKALNNTLTIGPDGIGFDWKKLFTFASGPVDAKTFAQTLADNLNAGFKSQEPGLQKTIQSVIDNAMARTKPGAQVQIFTDKNRPGLPPQDTDTSFQGAKDKAATDALTQAKYQLAQAEESYKTELERVKLLEDTGAITGLQADEQRRKAAEQYLQTLRQIDAEMPRLIAQQQQAGNVKGVEELRLEWQRVHLEQLKTLDDIAKSTFWGKIGLQIRTLANQWADLGKQVGGFLTQQFQNFASTAGNAIGGLITHTTNWKQAIGQLVQSFISGLATMVIQWVLARTVLAALNKAFGQADASAANAQAASASAAWSSAAVSASIATYGAAAGAGLTAYLSALGIGTAAATASAGVGGAGFEGGGFTGYGRDGEPAGIVHRNEVVFPAPRVSALGKDWLVNLAVGSLSRPGYQAGGFVGSSGSTRASGRQQSVEHHHFIFVDDFGAAVRAYQASPAGRKDFQRIKFRNRLS